MAEGYVRRAAGSRTSYESSISSHFKNPTKEPLRHIFVCNGGLNESEKKCCCCCCWTASDTGTERRTKTL